MLLTTKDWINNKASGRRVIKTNISLTGDIKKDLNNIKKILKKSLEVHKANVEEMDALFSIFYGETSIKKKSKLQRSDINNIISVNSPMSIVRTINSYCFGEPFKYLSSDTNLQSDIETFNETMNYANNYEATIDATLNGSIAGIGYKVGLPTSDDEIPFKVNGDIDPRFAFCVYSDEIIPESIMGVYIQDYIDDNDEKKGQKYTIWTKYYQLYLRDNDAKDDYVVIPQILNNQQVDAYPLFVNQVPLIDYPRNKFLLGDYELVIPLLDAKNQLMSNRIDDVQQLVDYLLVLTNCVFESDNDKKNVLSSRLLEIKSTDPNNKASAEILKNSLDQQGVQTLAEYIDVLIQEIVGIPSRQERGGGGGDTGQAVRYRNGFRDLENNAGIIVPKMEGSEKRFAKLCLNYCKNITNNRLSTSQLKALNIKIVFKRTLTDDPNSASQAYYNFVKGGMAPTDALIASKAVSDPAEVGSRCQIMDINGSTSAGSSSEDDKSPETSENEQG